ncbi:hypothetical protein ACMYSN_24645 [Klebsiella sp. R445]
MKKMKKSRAASMAALMALSMGPIPANAVGYRDITPHSTDANTTLQSLHEEVVYISISEATRLLAEIAERQRFHLINLRTEWEVKQTPIDMKKQSPLVQKHLVKEYKQRITIAAGYIEAVKMALQETKDEALRKEITTFGRAAAKLRNTAEDTLAFIEQTNPPKKTSSTPISASGDDVRALIHAEHKALGLNPPGFDRVS